MPIFSLTHHDGLTVKGCQKFWKCSHGFHRCAVTETTETIEMQLMFSSRPPTNQTLCVKRGLSFQTMRTRHRRTTTDVKLDCTSPWLGSVVVDHVASRGSRSLIPPLVARAHAVFAPFSLRSFRSKGRRHARASWHLFLFSFSSRGLSLSPPLSLSTISRFITREVLEGERRSFTLGRTLPSRCFFFFSSATQRLDSPRAQSTSQFDPHTFILLLCI